MQKLLQTIENLRVRLDDLRKHGLKETPTRTIVIGPILEALGWDVRDPNEVQEEYPTVDGRSVDYALMINGQPALLVEAKPLDDPLNNVKDITQVVGYAANAGIVWCILTNGIRWQVYRSVEQCPAPDKLMFEVSLDPRDAEGLSPANLGQQMWRFSRDEIAKGTLDALGEQTFTDGKVRKALDTILRDPPRQFVNLIKHTANDSSLTRQQVKSSIARIAAEPGTAAALPPKALPPTLPPQPPRIRRGRKGQGCYDEKHHLAKRPQEAASLYRAVERFCLSLKPGAIAQQYQAKSINFTHNKCIFCSVHVLQTGLRVWLKLKYARLTNPPSFARDVSHVGHYGSGDLELDISSLAQVDPAAELIRQSFETAI